MKILIFIESGGPGGAEQVVLSLAKRLKQRGIGVAVATLRTGWLTDNLNREEIEHIHILSTKSLDIGLPWRIARVVKNGGFTVIHSHLLDSNFYGVLAARIAGVPHLGTEHGDIHHIASKRFVPAKLRIMRFFRTRLSAVSAFSRQRLVDLGYPESLVTVVGNPIASAAVLTDSERKELRDSFFEAPLASNIWIWIHVANFRPVKDQLTLLRGFAESWRQGAANQRLVIVGDGDLRAELEAECDKLEISSAVCFLGFRDDVSKLLSAADGFILSSKSEAMPMSILEAAMAGLCVISSRVGGVPEVIKSEETGLLFPAEDPIALSSLLTSISSEQAKGRRLGEDLREYIRSRYEIDIVLDSYFDLYAL
jgi:glycosyltransferase involved in cell wall biosynthesis